MIHFSSPNYKSDIFSKNHVSGTARKIGVTFIWWFTNEIKFVKTISYEKNYLDRIYTAKIVYKRNPSLEYKMDYSMATPFERQMYYYSEECYPHDLIDDIILKGIQQNYPGARVSTMLMLCDVEKENIEKELNTYIRSEFQINIQPNITDVNEIIKMGKTQWRVFVKTLPVYLTNSKEIELFRNEGSFLYYNLDRENELIELEPTLLNEVMTF